MPAYQNPVQAGRKRPSEAAGRELESRKRQLLGSSRDDTDDGSGIANDPTKVGEQCWMVQWRKPQYKKHKTWDGDGILVLSGGKGTLYDLEHNLITIGKPNPDGACVGTLVSLGGREMEIDCAVPKEDFLSGKVFGLGNSNTSPEETRPVHASASTLTKKFIPLKSISTNSQRDRYPSTGSSDAPKKGIDLEPVGLLQQKSENFKEKPTLSVPTTYWSAHWRKPQGKKHKTWDGDAYVVHSDQKLTMISEDGRLMGTAKWNGTALREGYQTNIGNKVIELEDQVPSVMIPRIIGRMPLDVPFGDDNADIETSLVDDEYTESGTARLDPVSLAAKENISISIDSTAFTNPGTVQKKFVAPTNFYGKPDQHQQPKNPEPLHDPNSEGAIVMKQPPTTREYQKKFNPKGRPLVPVAIDPILGRHLRPHQRDGVKFMYECVMGLRNHEGQGCILADEMGMGKTLQTITLVWTLLKQSPYFGSPGIGRVLIVCPVSLIANWKKEFHKWLGKDRVGILIGDKDKEVIKRFQNSKIHHVLIIGYEKLRSVIKDLAYCIPQIGLVICDEGHRLKSANNKTSTMFDVLPTSRRIILSGTPIQNDLSEFHAMADFCNPGLLDDYSVFRKVFENPILKSRAPGCSAKELEVGEARHEQLQTVAKSFVLRRDASILKNYLPPKHEYVVFVTPSALQKAMFTKILQPEVLSALVRGSMARSLAMIQLLTKLSNSPILFKAALEKRKIKSTGTNEDLEANESFEDALEMLPNNARPEDVELSGKLHALSKILSYLRKETEEKCILVSHYTSTLDVIETYCKKKKYSFLRLDGQTPVAKRQEYVDDFNKAPQARIFIFLLSAKAGGVGLNLIGASRLCLIDSDWNPSHDLQSMARIHRDGQKRPVFIYRLLTAGTIDEKIFQRQVTKLGLSDCERIIAPPVSVTNIGSKGTSDGGGSSKSDSFTHKDLRDLFTFHNRTACHTHELLGCLCIHRTLGENAEEEEEEPLDDAQSDLSSEELDDMDHPQELGFRKASLHRPEEAAVIEKALAKKKKAELASLGEWTHINCLDSSKQSSILDEALQATVFTSSKTSDGVTTHRNTIDPEQLGHTLSDTIPGGTICFLFERSSKMCV
ncbi:hypothetical protein M0805_006394 [Coniferiporia weirii]|nr:hypothetical protein M0805_006394 [Coniferiporia weirii]